MRQFAPILVGTLLLCFPLLPSPCGVARGDDQQPAAEVKPAKEQPAEKQQEKAKKSQSEAGPAATGRRS